VDRTEHETGRACTTTVTAFKWVRLLALEKANEVTLPEEFPFIVSTNVSSDSRCSECGCADRPVTYVLGRTAVAHHFHRHSGGIYHKSPAIPLALCGAPADKQAGSSRLSLGAGSLAIRLRQPRPC
jgi:hypothetical protein